MCPLSFWKNKWKHSGNVSELKGYETLEKDEEKDSDLFGWEIFTFGQLLDTIACILASVFLYIAYDILKHETC